MAPTTETLNDLDRIDPSFEQRAGRVTLSAAQREAAKIAGVSETTYAAHVGELAKRKAQGFYEN